MELIGSLISLLPYTLRRCHEFWGSYTADPDMWEGEFVYVESKIDQYYQSKVRDPARIFFAICREGKTVGEIQLKYINRSIACGTMSIHLANDSYKNHGWGTEAEQLMINYAFGQLGLNKILADCVHRNKRSQHVLEKLGFVHIRDDAVFRYYQLEKPKTLE